MSDNKPDQTTKTESKQMYPQAETNFNRFVVKTLGRGVVSPICRGYELPRTPQTLMLEGEKRAVLKICEELATVEELKEKKQEWEDAIEMALKEW